MKDSLKTSLILTVYNEGDNIRALLDSIKNQTRAADEVVIVDGGSKDNTISEIKRFMNKNSELEIKLFVKQGYNIPKGRNFAIDQAAGEIVFVTDGGCILDKDWCANFFNSFREEQTEIVGGIYEGIASGYFQLCMNKLTVPSAKEFAKARFIPSSRSFAFRKRCWKTVGGYPEHLYRAEDTWFVNQLIKRGFEIITNHQAKVYWKQRAGIKEFLKQVFGYADGDGLAINFSSAYYRSFTNTILLLFSALFKLLLFVYLLSFLYGLWRHRSRFSRNELYLFPGVLLLRFLEELTRTIGFLYGAITAKRRLRIIILSHG